MAIRTGPITVPENRHKRARRARAAQSTPSYHATRLLRSVHDDAAAWAESIAAELPPFTEAEAAAFGKLAAKLDALLAVPSDSGGQAA